MRFCPLCDAEMHASTCAVHAVPTIDLTPRQRTPLAPGSIVADRYRVESALREGGMGELFLGTQLALGRRVVIKSIRDDRLSDRRHLVRFYLEARSVSRIHHPNVVRLIEFGVDGETQLPYLVMDYVGGVSLASLLEREQRLTEQRTAKLLLQVARALLAAHASDVLHRDLKPANIMVAELPDGSEHVSVLDFGLAKILDARLDLVAPTAPGEALGTPAYMSPEQAMAGEVDGRSDLYSLGCILHRALAGRTPYEDSNVLALMRKHVEARIPSLPERLVDDTAPSDELRALHARLLAKSKLERPATQEVVGALAHLAGSLSVEGHRFFIPEATTERGGIHLDDTTATNLGDTVPRDTVPMAAPKKRIDGSSFIVALLIALLLAGFGAVAWLMVGV